MANHFSNFNYRRNLIILLIFLQLLTVTSILLLSRINVDRVIVDNAYSSIAQKIAQSLDHTRAFLEPAYMTSKTLKTMAENDVVNFIDIDTVEKFFFTELLDHPNFAGIYIANEKGDFIYMRREDAQNKTSSDANEKFQTKFILNTKNTRDIKLRWRNHAFELTDQKQDSSDKYTPLTRPWYLLAMEKNQIIWTKPYTFFTSKKPGITIAIPYQNKNNQLKGVIGIDIELHQLSTFLDKINFDKYYIRINDTENNLIAETSNKSALSESDLNKLSLKGAGHGTFKEANEEYLYIHETLTSEENSITFPEWNLFSTAKTYPFLVEIRDIEKRNILIAALTFLLSIFFSWLIANKTSKPVENWMNQATTDNLTGLYNRHFFFNTGNTKYSEYQQNDNVHLAVMMVDMDNLKQVNDNYGHNIGDEIIKAVAKCLQSSIGSDDLLARYGGDEFILLTKVKSTHQITRFADDLRNNVEKLKASTSSGDINVTISIGVALTSQNQNLSFLDFIDLADQTLYQSKNSGRNKVRFINSQSQEENLETFKIH